MWLFYCRTRYFGSVHCFCGLKILILNGPGLQIQTNGTAPNICWVGWVGTNIRGVGTSAGSGSKLNKWNHLINHA